MFHDPKAYLRSLLTVYSEEVHGGLDFWADHGVDWEKGGLVTYLDRQGKWYLDEKQGWFTGRTMYSFAKGYNDIDKKQRWLDAALNLYDFMIKHQFVEGNKGKLYHNMNRDGVPCKADPKAGEHVSAAPYVYPGLHDESFAVMGLAELYKATGRQDIKKTFYEMVETQQLIYHNPKYYFEGIMNTEEKAPKQALSTLMSLMCSIQTARGCDPEREEYYTGLMKEYTDQLFEYYYDEELGVLTEKEVDCPGHSMEVTWFALAEGLYTGNQELVNKCADIVSKLLELGWDWQYGGFCVFANYRNGPAFEVNQNLKYWWPNNELEIGLMYSYIGTGKEEFLEKYRMVHDWVFGHFPDRVYGEWYGYLNHDGTPLSHTKGDNQKGAYHLYRSFYAIYDLIKVYLDKCDK